MAVYDEAVRILPRVRRGLDVDDIAEQIAEAVLEAAESIMSRVPDPVRYARIAAAHRGVSHDRTQRAQRGEGVRLIRRPDGTLGPARPYVSGDAPSGEHGTLFAVAVQPDDAYARVDDQMVAAALLRQYCSGLTDREVHELWLVDAHGCTVQEVAAWSGQRRETVNRRLSATRRRVRQTRVDMSTGSDPLG